MNRTKRLGYTVLEMVVVLAILIMLAAVILPSLAGYNSNSKQRAAADIIRTRLAEARAKAMERGIPMRVGVSADMTRIRVAADGDIFDVIQIDNPPGPDSQGTEDTFDPAVTINIMLNADDTRQIPSPGGFLTICTYKSNGDTREYEPMIAAVQQQNFQPIQIQIHGLTGQVRTLQGQQNVLQGQLSITGSQANGSQSSSNTGGQP